MGFKVSNAFFQVLKLWISKFQKKNLKFWNFGFQSFKQKPKILKLWMGCSKFQNFRFLFWNFEVLTFGEDIQIKTTIHENNHSKKNLQICEFCEGTTYDFSIEVKSNGKSRLFSASFFWNGLNPDNPMILDTEPNQLLD